MACGLRAATLWRLLLTLAVFGILLSIALPNFRAAQRAQLGIAIGHEINQALGFTPSIVINEKTVASQRVTSTELESVSKRFNHRLDWNANETRGRNVQIIGACVAKAGFDLTKTFELRIIGDHALVLAPEPQLLSCEPEGDVTFTAGTGPWTFDSDEDRGQAIAAFIADARQPALKATYAETKLSFETIMRKILEQHGKTVEFRYTSPVSREM